HRCGARRYHDQGAVSHPPFSCEEPRQKHHRKCAEKTEYKRHDCREWVHVRSAAERPELRHAGRMTSSAIAELETPPRVAGSDFDSVLMPGGGWKDKLYLDGLNAIMTVPLFTERLLLLPNGLHTLRSVLGYRAADPRKDLDEPRLASVL